jgi:hypothetical protein
MDYKSYDCLGCLGTGVNVCTTFSPAQSCELYSVVRFDCCDHHSLGVSIVLARASAAYFSYNELERRDCPPDVSARRLVDLTTALDLHLKMHPGKPPTEKVC